MLITDHCLLIKLSVALLCSTAYVSASSPSIMGMSSMASSAEAATVLSLEWKVE